MLWRPRYFVLPQISKLKVELSGNPFHSHATNLLEKMLDLMAVLKLQSDNASFKPFVLSGVAEKSWAPPSPLAGSHSPCTPSSNPQGLSSRAAALLICGSSCPSCGAFCLFWVPLKGFSLPSPQGYQGPLSWSSNTWLINLLLSKLGIVPAFGCAILSCPPAYR